MRRARPIVAALLALGVALVAQLGCGVTLEPSVSADAGRACLVDSDCVPDACCGRGQNAVHVLDGPDCSTARCDGTCPPAQLRCGCALPICRDQRCAVAVTVGPGCS